MATYGDLLNRVLKNCGRGDSGDDRAQVLTYLIEITRTDIPQAVGGPFVQGYVSISTEAGTDEIDCPASLRSFEGPLVFNSTYVWIDEEQVFYDPIRFMQRWVGKLTEQGEPTEVLVFGRKFRFKKTPDGVYTAELYGTLWPDVSSYGEGTTAERAYEAALEAGATTMLAASREQTDVVQVWSNIWASRLAGLTSASNAWSHGNPPGKDF